MLHQLQRNAALLSQLAITPTAGQDSSGNVAAGPLVFRIAAPDLSPPQFQQASAVGSAAADTSLAVSVRLDERCSVAYAVLAANATAPTVEQVREGERDARLRPFAFESALLHYM